ncbi:inactive rhomboid protein 1-like isoform X1 [Toxorhynchites rutilus septentrionalis]|uniref:inactive rhomboid protein 1-like isoform X1 n=1 Tax=Toxorhynchites rutilus septentrionalis TaxID=329112 RepID=UPI0024784524|nr:inactive rhomboid protein 1-like isoform X1 [Toxorhynchites rutilus septentrionalis]
MSRSRRSSFGHNHYQQQFTVTSTINCSDGLCDSGASVSQNGAPSPSRFSDSSYSNLGTRLTAFVTPPSSECYRNNENLRPCCVATPSPATAPSNDRYSTSSAPTSIIAYPDNRNAPHHRSMSPSSRTRYPVPERFRDPPPPKTDQFGNYLINNPPLMTNSESYNYLTSSVHTPVKRYIPTPPPPENYQQDMGLGPSLMAGLIASKGGINIINQAASRASVVTTLPYRLKVESKASQVQQLGGDTTDHYATPPRARPVKCSQPLCTFTQSRQLCPAVATDYTILRTPTPVSIMSEPMNSTSEENCYHCNSLRRATGVHQTTQTSGPISPQPLSISSVSMSEMERQSPITPPSLVSHTSYSHQHPLVAPGDDGRNGSSLIISQSHTLNSSCSNPSIIIQYQQQHFQHQQIQQQPLYQQLQQLQQQHVQQQILPLQQLPPPRLQPDSTPSTLQRNTQQIRTRLSHKQRIKEYIRRSTSQFFGVDVLNEEYEQQKWEDRQKRLAVRRFGPLKEDAVVSRVNEVHVDVLNDHSDRPDILPAQSQDEPETEQNRRQRFNPYYRHDGTDGFQIERKSSVSQMVAEGFVFVVQSLRNRIPRKQKQWSRSFAPAHVALNNDDNDLCDGLTPIQDDELFFDIPTLANQHQVEQDNGVENSRQIYLMDPNRAVISNGWLTRSAEIQLQQQQQQQRSARSRNALYQYYGQRITGHILDSALDNSRRPSSHCIKLLRPNSLDDRYDYRPFFTYWINTTQVLVLLLTLLCYGIGPIGIGYEQKSGQVLVTSLNLQTVQHYEQRSLWIGLRRDDLVHLGAKYAACMRRDTKVMELISKTRKQERETACCIRNDDSGCVQSSQADCSVRGLWPTTISTWKKWSPGDSGPGGRISGSVCGLDPKYCEAPASVAPHEWPDDITKWPICRKNNQISQKFRFKDHTAEHMVCEVIGHPCCVGISGECRITTREYCDFVRGYFHEEASLCSQVSCLNDVCGMFPFIATDIPDQFYRLFTSLYLHAGIVHIMLTLAFQYILLSDLERLLGSLRTAILYIGSGIAGNLTSAIFAPYRPEVGPLPSLAGTLSSLLTLLFVCHWKNLKRPHLALLKLIIVGFLVFGLSTLPWQQNFTGLVSGLIFGTTFTLALTPYLNVRNYSRKRKINLIWTCFVLHFVLYAIMFLIFYLFSSPFSLDFVDGNQVASVSDNGGLHDHFNPYDTFNYFNNKHSDSIGSGSDGGGGSTGQPNGGHREYDRGGGTGGGRIDGGGRYGNGGGAISMSGGTIKNINPKYNNIHSSNTNHNAKTNSHSHKLVAICEKGQCNPRPNA